MYYDPQTIEVYKNVLEKNEPFPAHFFTFGTQKQKASDIIKYLLLEKLQIKDYEEAKKVMDRKFCEKYHLTSLLKFNEIPEMLDDECYHLAWYAFPDKVMTADELTLKTYQDVLDGKRKNFPSKYFTKAADPEHMANLCFKYLCEEVLKLKTKQDILKVFGYSSGIKVITQYKLKIVLNTVYPSLSQLLVSTYPDIFSAEE